MGSQVAEFPQGAVVVVDDDADARRIFAMFLRTSGYQAIVADKRANVLSLIRLAHARAVVVDIPPDPSANASMIRGLRNDPHLKEIPVIGVTIHAGPEDLPGIQATGYNAVLLKPVTREVLVECVRRGIEEATAFRP